MQKIRNLFKHEEGFTLIELLVVIAVLGILAAIAIPRISGVTGKAREAELKATGSSIRSAVEMYIAENDSFPGGTGGLDFSNSDYNIGINLDEYDITVAANNGTGPDTTAYKITVKTLDSDGTVVASPYVEVTESGINLSQ